MVDDICAADPAVARQALLDAVTGLDEHRVNRVAQEVLDAQGIDVLVADVLVPTLHDIGELWHAGSLSVMHEHFASSIIRSVLGDIRRNVGSAERPRVVIGCPPGELHDLPCHLFGLMLVDRGLTPIVLGADTPMAGMAHAARKTRAAACVLTARRSRSALAYADELRSMARYRAVFVAGPAAGSSLRHNLPVDPLSDDWREAADTVAARCQEPIIAPRPVQKVASVAPAAGEQQVQRT